MLFHGTPGSRLVGALGHDAAVKCGVRLICPDRPGYGRTTFSRRSLLQYADDIVELANALDCSRFSVVGASGGAPYAAACAKQLSERLAGVAIVSGIGPLDAPDSLDLINPGDRSLIKLARRAPWALTPVVCLLSFTVSHFIDRTMKASHGALPESDRALLADPVVAAKYRAMALEGWRGARGIAWDEVLFSRPWGFQLEEIEMPVCLWHGEADTAILPEMAHRVAAAIPLCHATFYSDDGHMLAISRMEEILRVVTAPPSN